MLNLNKLRCVLKINGEGWDRGLYLSIPSVMLELPDYSGYVQKSSVT
jgi:hypothetical protein